MAAANNSGEFFLKLTIIETMAELHAHEIS